MNDRDLKREREIARAEQEAAPLKKWKPPKIVHAVRTAIARESHNAVSTEEWLRRAEREKREIERSEVETSVSPCKLKEF